jgi:diaminohydroxyphosphoribosylaminopyrimidine deaminase / 5-amino-6-(5-phosphoribosylamino)uracil reductase
VTATSASGDDRAHLARAVALAESVRARTSPNPPVGCVLVRDGRVVGEGATAPAGGPHAEVRALEAAGPAARGATAYVTLEPCAHHGRTPPCSDALIAAGVARVVHAQADPNPVARGGADALIRAGVAVTGPDAVGSLLTAVVGQQLEGFLRVVRTGRPHVTLKLAQTADGRLAAPDGRRWITGAAARRAVHRWRAAVDAVLVGSGTVLADDPGLDVRDVASDHQPRPVVFDARLRTPPTAKVARPGAIVVTSDRAPFAAREALEATGVEVVAVPGAADGGVDLAAALAALAGCGVRTVLAEPGPTLAGRLVATDLVDRVVLHVAMTLGDGHPARAVTPPPGRTWRTERVGGAGEDLIVHLVPTAAGRTAPAEEAA